MSKNLHARVKALSEVIAKSITVDDSGVATTSNSKLYTNNLPEGLTRQITKDVHRYDEDFTAASIHAIGSAGITAMAAKPALRRVHGTIDLADGIAVDASVARKHIAKDTDASGTVVETVTFGRARGVVTRNSEEAMAAIAEIAALGQAQLAK